MHKILGENCKFLVGNISKFLRVTYFLLQNLTITTVCWREFQTIRFKDYNMQNAAAMIICDLQKYDHIILSLHDLHWSPVKHRIGFKILLLLTKSNIIMVCPQCSFDVIGPYGWSYWSWKSCSFCVKLPIFTLLILAVPKTYTQNPKYLKFPWNILKSFSTWVVLM